MEPVAVSAWVDRYVQAWNTNDPAEIGALFTDDAVYYHAPFAAGWHGRATIVAEWLGRKDEPGDTTFRYEVLAAQDGLGIVRGWTHYHTQPPREFSNLWVIRLGADGRCSEFTEWWMQKPAR
jgi:uncharacterized protein (TIGR02246 family)